ncbi:C40 family peptidase [Streptomyces luteogriseus]|uniref:C40 family peptidase n=1 Tax=Streptomyces luteogriseus TaxID=68233 RepID=UPI0027D80430|nr:C40 family peptidase [Streptomyces luteogriseus]
MATESEAPSPDEVRRYVDSLYDRAESDTGTFNATRAAAIPRQRGAAPRDRSQEDTEPAFGSLARQWFDAARAKLGPTVPASLPDRRLPARPDRVPRAVRPVRPAGPPAEPLALEASTAPSHVVWELTGGSAQASTTAAIPQLSGRPAAPPAVSDSGQDESRWRADAHLVPSGDVAGWPRYEAEPAPAPDPGPAPAPQPGPAPAPQFAAAPATGPDLTTAHGAALPDITAPAVAALAPALPVELSTTVAPTASTTAPVPMPPVLSAAPETTYTTVASAAYGGSWPSSDAGHRSQAERVIAFARAQIGRPCVWGAVGPGSYDAPGLTQAAWKAAGVTLPRTAEAQWRAGMQVSLADVQVGDLVFFHDDLRHVGICSGDGTMIHAPGPGARIQEESVFFAGRSAIKGVIRPA